MSLEDTIILNTRAVKELTAAIERLLAVEAPVSCAKECVTEVVQEVKPEVKVAEIKVEKVKETPCLPADVTYSEVKALIHKLAADHREKIKALNVQFKLKVFDDVLVDRADIEKGVKDQNLLTDYYASLLKLGE